MDIITEVRSRVSYKGKYENWRKVAREDVLQSQSIDRLEHAARNTPGVHYHGRVSQERLTQEFLTAGLWAYPTWFTETSCITAMEAQAAGLRCVCPDIAALAETVGERTWTGDAVADVVAMMGPRKYAAFHQMIDDEYTSEAARRFSLDTLADSWEARLNKLVTDAAANVAPKFHEVAR